MIKSALKFDSIIVIHPNDLVWMNNKAEAKLERPAGTNLFTQALYKPNGNVIGYWCSLVMPGDWLDMVVAMLDAKPYTWTWLWVRERLAEGQLQELKQQLKDEYDHAQYKSEEWQTRSHGYAKLLEPEPANPAAYVLDYLTGILGFAVSPINPNP